MVSNLAGSAHGRCGFFHGVANRGDYQTGVALGGFRGLVVQNPADDWQAGAAAGQPRPQCAAKVVNVQVTHLVVLQMQPMLLCQGGVAFDGLDREVDGLFKGQLVVESGPLPSLLTPPPDPMPCCADPSPRNRMENEAQSGPILNVPGGFRRPAQELRCLRVCEKRWTLGPGAWRRRRALRMWSSIAAFRPISAAPAPQRRHGPQ